MLHLTHVVIVRMKSPARMHMWWPNIEVDIAAHCKDCAACAETCQTYLKIFSRGRFWSLMAAHSHWCCRTVPRWHVVGRHGCVLEMATRSANIRHLRRPPSMTCLLSEACQRRWYLTMVRSSPQKYVWWPVQCRLDCISICTIAPRIEWWRWTALCGTTTSSQT